MRPVKTFPIPPRILIGLWAGIFFFGGIAYAQERNIDTLHIFKADTVRLGFDDVLPLSAIYDSADREDWHYIYRWNTGDRTDAIQVKFEGKRKALYIGQRFSAIHWPGEYDTLLLDTPVSYQYIYYYYADPMNDTVILRAPDMDGTTVKYEWSNYSSFIEELLLSDTEQYAVVYKDMWKQLGWEYGSEYYSCRATAVSEKGDTTVLQSVLALFFGKNGGLVQTSKGRQLHNYNIWSMHEWTQIYARLGDTLHFSSEIDYDVYPEYAYVADLEFTGNMWLIFPCRFNLPLDGIRDSVTYIYISKTTYIKTPSRATLATTPRRVQ